MKKAIILAIVILPFTIQAQEIGLSENYKTKKEERQASFKQYKIGDLVVNTSFSSVGKGIGLMYNAGAEYMFNEKLGIRASYSSNNISGGLRFWGYSRYSADITYHFIQKKRWDVYAFTGIGAERYRYSLYQSNETFSKTRPVLNAGVGARYKVTPTFGAQVELGRISSIGIYKKFGLKRK